MNADVQTVLRRTTPESLPDPDVATLRRRGLRRRAVKRTASVLSLALVLGGVGLGVALNRPAPVRFAEKAPVGWQELDLQAAVERLRETAREKAALPPAAPGNVREVRAMGTAGRGVSGPEGPEEWMLPFRVRVRDDRQIWQLVYDEERIELGTTLEQVRAILAELPPADFSKFKTWDSGVNEDQGDHVPLASLDEAEHLATKPDPWEPAPGETERPERAYAFVRLADALREHPVEPAALDRAYGVLASLGEQWVRYRGLVEDLAGRQAVAFSALDPGNNSENWLLFDPDTGRAWGELTYQALPDGPQFRGGAAVDYVEVRR